MSGKKQIVMVILLLNTYVVHGTASTQERIIKIGQRENLGGRDRQLSLKLFLEVVPKWKSNFWDAPTF